MYLTHKKKNNNKKNVGLVKYVVKDYYPVKDNIFQHDPKQPSY